jgi:hypothetical protein
LRVFYSCVSSSVLPPLVCSTGMPLVVRQFERFMTPSETEGRNLVTDALRGVGTDVLTPHDNTLSLGRRLSFSPKTV